MLPLRSIGLLNLLSFLGLTALVVAESPAVGARTVANGRPNLLMIMVDDLGYSDLGCYGSEIETPHLDRLAQRGLRFSQFYNTAKCHSSRVSLLTGQYCIAAGNEGLGHAVTSAEVLRDGGYFTAMTGKWHLKRQPTDFGFQRYFGHLSGACNYFWGDNTFRLNGQPFSVPREGFYTTVANVDYGLEFLEQADTADQPWHLYVAFNAPHAPLQALPEDYAKYEGRYDVGWDAIRRRRVERQRELGLLPEGFLASERPEHVPAWETLGPQRRKFETKRMTALAGMIDRVDQEIGRLLAYLESTEQLENTLIWFVSDNGACPYDRRSRAIDAKPISGDVRWSDSTGWAWARNTPFRYYKQNQYEGGIATPAIVHWPAGLSVPAGSICRQPAHLIDVLPTLAEIGDCEIPRQHPERELRPVSGVSLVPLFEGQSLTRPEPLHFLFFKDRALRDGDWKAVSFRSEPWELYNLAEDRTERVDQSERHPQRLRAMVAKWHAMAERALHAKEATRRPVDSEPSLPHRHPEWTAFDLPPGTPARARGTRRSRRAGGIRARKNTRVTREAGTLQLSFTGEDPGLAFDRLPGDLPAGPLTLAFELRSRASGGGEVYFTVTPGTSLPRGQHFEFEVQHDDQWHHHRLELDTDRQPLKLRLDVAEGRGTAQLRGLQLRAGQKTVWQFPASQ